MYQITIFCQIQWGVGLKNASRWTTVPLQYRCFLHQRFFASTQKYAVHKNEWMFSTSSFFLPYLVFHNCFSFFFKKKQILSKGWHLVNKSKEIIILAVALLNLRSWSLVICTYIFINKVVSIYLSIVVFL